MNHSRIAVTSRLAALATLLCMPFAAAAGWEIAKHEGREYVSVDSLKRFYNFASVNSKIKSLEAKVLELETKAKK